MRAAGVAGALGITSIRSVGLTPAERTPVQNLTSRLNDSRFARLAIALTLTVATLAGVFLSCDEVGRTSGAPPARTTSGKKISSESGGRRPPFHPTNPALGRLMSALGGKPSEAVTVGNADLAKMDSALQDLAAEDIENRGMPASGSHQDLRVSGGGRVLVDVYLQGNVTRGARLVRRAGMDVTAKSNRAPERLVEGWVRAGAVTRIAQLDVTKAIEPVVEAGADTGSITSEGDGAHQGPPARSLGAQGSGVTVGVISDSMDKGGGRRLADSKRTGDLPNDVRVLRDNPNGTDEGRAMAEVIYDEAPGTSAFLFYSGSGGAARKMEAIKALTDSGAQVIADDLPIPTEPFFQEGAVAKVVNDAKDKGVAYFASAGNRGRQSYEATFNPTASGLHDFGGGDTQQTIVSVPDQYTIRIYLQWAERWTKASTNLDAFLHDTNDGSLLASATTDNIANTLPSEYVGWKNTTGVSVPVSLRIKRTAGSATPLIKYIGLLQDTKGISRSFTIDEHNTSSGAINPDAASASGSLAVASVRYNQPGLNQPVSNSSRGPVERPFDSEGNILATPAMLQKPQLAAADAVSTSVPGFPRFYGTSAAVASAAGIGALVKSADPSISVDRLQSIMTDPKNAIPCSPSPPDYDCGAGFVLADRAVRAACVTAPLAQTASSVEGAVNMTITGKISPNCAETTYYFEYGPTTGYGQRTPAAQLAAGVAPQTVAAHLTLQPGSTYHYRLVAINKAGTTTTPDVTFRVPTDCSFSIASSQRVLKLGRVTAGVTCDEAGQAKAEVAISFSGGGAFKIGKVYGAVTANKMTKLKVALSRKARSRIKRALRHRKKLRATVTVKVAWGKGHIRTQKLIVYLKR
jgi:hypothetical protein